MVRGAYNLAGGSAPRVANAQGWRPEHGRWQHIRGVLRMPRGELAQKRGPANAAAKRIDKAAPAPERPLWGGGEGA